MGVLSEPVEPVELKAHGQGFEKSQRHPLSQGWGKWNPKGLPKDEPAT